MEFFGCVLGVLFYFVMLFVCFFCFVVGICEFVSSDIGCFFKRLSLGKSVVFLLFSVLYLSFIESRDIYYSPWLLVFFCGMWCLASLNQMRVVIYG